MADEYSNYEGYDDNDRYDEDDMSGGGEQIGAAMAYINDQVKIIEDTKQGMIILQPNEPPANPKTNDMYIDTNQFPNVIYVWDGTIWLKTGATSPEEIGSYSIAETDDAVNNVQLNLDSVAGRTTTIEEKVDPDMLTTTVTQHQTYVDDRNKAVKDGIDALTGNLADEAYLNANFPKMITESVLQSKADAITASFKSSGGVNLLRNSVGYGKNTDGTILNWQVTSGVATQQIGDEMIDAKSGFNLSDGVIVQLMQANAGEPYTVTAKVAKGTAGAAWMKLSDGTNFQQVDMINTQAYNYDYIQISGFIPANNVLILELGAAAATGGAIFTAIMVNTGTVGLQWSHANGELYNTAVQMDINGLQVKSNQYDGYTVMSPFEFSGYYRNGQGIMQQVFTLNKDVTEVAKLNLTDPAAELTMGSLKLILIDGGGNKGWALIPSS